MIQIFEYLQRKRNQMFIISLFLVILLSSCERSRINFVESENKIDIFIGDKFFTSYLFGGFDYEKINGNTGVGGFDNGFVAKPVLYPIKSPSDITITRGYPLIDITGESKDHPGHLGILFAYLIDRKNNFWDNSSNVIQIKHIEVLDIKVSRKDGKIKTLNNWINHEKKVLLEETREMKFKSAAQGYTIGFDITLMAKDSIVTFPDNKQGLFQIRVADWLRETVESEWMKSRIPNATGTGTYKSSDGAVNEHGIWGRRANWVCLEGNKNGHKVGVAIFDHPESFNHPTHWMVRSYGLFAANPLGQGEFEKLRGVKNPKYLNLTLLKGEKVNFRYQILIYEGEKSIEELDSIYNIYCRD